MSANTVVDLIVNQKSSFEVGFFVKQSNGAVLDLNGYSVVAKYKQDLQMSDGSARSFNSQVVNAAAGEISISLTPQQTSEMNIGRYFYDVAIIDTEDFKTRIVEGTIKVSGGVS